MDRNNKRLTRRQFIKLMLSGAFLMTLAVPFLLALKNNSTFSLVALKRMVTVKLDHTTPVGRLNTDELLTITRLVKILLPSDSVSGASTDWVHTYVNHTTETRSGYLNEYQHAVVFLDAAAADLRPALHNFHLLSDTDANLVVSEMFDGLQSATARQKKIARIVNSGAAKERCWDFIASELIQAFYHSADGWAVRGYHKYPGIAGDPRAYTSPPLSVRKEVVDI